jgi:non-ribosomal peptide synthetase-like protein
MTVDLVKPPPPQVVDGSPATDTEIALSEVLAEVVQIESLSVDGHFFDDLGADSMVMAQFCARVRKREGLPSVSIKEVYEHPTIRSLATSFADEEATPVEASPGGDAERTAPAGTARYVLCGALQLVAFLGYLYVAALVFVQGYEWISAGSGPIELYLRAVLVGGATFIGACSVPILAKWVLVGRWKRQEIRVWSLAYVRFWIVKTLIRRNPLVLFAGSPLYSLYLRALGARVGRGTLILSRNVPVCTDLLTIGDGTVIRKDSFFTCYRAEAGVIQTGAVTLGRDAFVGEAAVLDIETSIGDGGQLGHSSSLHAGQAVPDGERVHGSPALERTEVDHRAVDPAAVGTLRRTAYGAFQVLATLALRVPLAIGGVALLIAAVPQLSALLSSGGAASTDWTFYGNALAASFALFFGSLVVGLAVVVTVPRALNLALKPGRAYRLYGFHYGVHRAIERMTNVRFFPRLLGDSSYIVPYLRWLGYDLSQVVQTGSNFGLEVKHENPYLSTIGSGTMVADGLSIVNTEFSGTSFRVSRTTIGPLNYLGNYITYPAQGRTSDDCLVGTKAMVPLDGDSREGTGLLGSPSFEIPRSVQRDKRFDHLARGDELRRRLAAKNRHNAVTIGFYLLAWWTLRRDRALRAGGEPPRLGRCCGLRAGRRPRARVQARALRLGRAARHRLPGPPTPVLLDLAVLLVARALLEAGHAAVDSRRHAVQEPHVAASRSPDRQARIRRRVRHRREDPDHHRGRRHPQCEERHPGALAGGRHLQVRQHRDRRRVHGRHRCPGPLRGDDARRCGARARFLPHEGRGGPTARPVGGKPGPRAPRRQLSLG